MNECLSEAELGALARGELPPDTAAKAQQHVATCATCYAQLLRGDQHDTGEGDTAELSGKPKWAEHASPDVAWQPGTDLGRYVILQPLGKGGMGVVFRAYDKELDRAVALKVLHDDGGESSTTGGSTRLLREAQAMARLSHPNVVAVHDVVVLQTRVCVVMELVDGLSLREWLKQEPKPAWRAIVEVFRAAGEGLAAAHDAKLVHRDFKPDNVLVGQDGRIRVTDFGIARLAGDESAAASVSEASAHVGLSSMGGGSSLGSPITREGQVVGTPRYMAPEQFAKCPADFRTDQFSFAVALYESLYGQYPFAGDSLPERLSHARKGEVQPQPSQSSVPQWLFRIVARALSAEPPARFGSMRELTHALGRDPSHRRNRLLAWAAAGAVVVAGIAVTAQSVHARAQLCTGSEEKLQGIWDEGRREQVHQAFTATGLPFAEDSFHLAAQVLDDYTQRWAASHKDACLATSVRGEQSAQVLTLRMACLQERLDAVSAMTDLLVKADPGLVGKAKQALDALPRLAACSDVVRLSARVPPPDDPKVAAEVDRIRRELTRARIVQEAGHPDQAEALVRPALEAAVKTAYSPVRAEAEYALGAALSAQTKYDDGIKLMTGAFTRALADGYDELLARAAERLAGAEYRRRKDARAWEWSDFAESLNRRARDPETAAMICNARGNIARNSGDYAKAAQYYQQGADEAKAKLGPEHMTTLGLTYNLASALQNQGRFREASVRYVAVIDAARRTLGRRHPFLAYPLVGSAIVATFRGEYAQAKRLYEEVLEITGGKGMNSDNAYDGLGDIAMEEGRWDDALAFYDKAIAVHDVLSPSGIDALGSVARQGLAYLGKGDVPNAQQLFDRVITRGANEEGAFDGVSDARMGQARILLLQGKAQAALPLAEAAVARLIPKRGDAHPSTLEARLLVANVRLALGQTEQAHKDAQAVLEDAKPELGEAHPLSKQARELLEKGTP